MPCEHTVGSEGESIVQPKSARGDARDPSDLVDLTESRVHRLAYTDPGIFHDEVESIFRSTWIYVAHETEIPEPGDYKTSTVVDEPLVIVRSDDEEIRVLINRCRHRGATVCQDTSGNARFFRCEYHGWTYRNSGQLVGVTYAEAYDDSFDKDALGLRPLPRVENYRGFVFASFNPDVPPLVEHLAGAREYLDSFVDQADGLPLRASHGTQQIAYNGNWKFQLENGCDGYHPNFTHRSFYRVMSQHGDQDAGHYMDNRATARSRALGNGHAVLDQRESSGSHYAERVRLSPGAGPMLERLAELYDDEQLETLLSRASSCGFNLTIFPNLQVIGTHIREICPQSVDRTIVRYTPLTVAGHPDELNQLRLRAHELFYTAAGFGVPDDGEMFRRVSSGLHAREEWLLLSRGRAREVTQGEISDGHITDELAQRAEWTRWLELMSANRAKAEAGA